MLVIQLLAEVPQARVRAHSAANENAGIEKLEFFGTCKIIW